MRHAHQLILKADPLQRSASTEFQNSFNTTGRKVIFGYNKANRTLADNDSTAVKNVEDQVIENWVEEGIDAREAT